MAKQTKRSRTAKRRNHKYKSRATLSKMYRKTRRTIRRKPTPAVGRSSSPDWINNQIPANTDPNYDHPSSNRRINAVGLDLNVGRVITGSPDHQIHANTDEHVYDNNPISRRKIKISAD